MEFLFKQIDKLSINELRSVAKYANTRYVNEMNNARNSIENIYSLSFPEFFAAHSEYHGRPGFGFAFEDWMIHQNNWRKLDKVDNPGDAINHNGIRIEIKYASVQKSKTIIWNHVTQDTKAAQFLLYAHDWNNSGKVYSFHVNKARALQLRNMNKNNQVCASFNGKGNWENLMPYSLGVADYPIVPADLKSPARFRLAS